MSVHSDADNAVIMEIMGLGAKSAQKSYYPQLRKKLIEFEKEKERYRTIISALSDMIFVMDENNRLLEYYGAGVVDLLSTDELEHKKPEDIADFPWLMEYNKALEFVRTTGQTYHMNLVQNMRGDRWYSANFNLHENKEYVVISVRDVTEIRNTRLELEKTKNYIDDILNSMPFMLIGVDWDLNVTQWNKNAVVQTGISVEDAKGKTITELLPLTKSIVDTIMESLQKSEVKLLSGQKRYQDKQLVYEDITIYPLTDSVSSGAVILIEDVSEYMKLQKAMLQSEKMMTVGGLAAGMAHEINNPLAGIIQNGEVLKNRLFGNSNANARKAESIGVDINLVREYLIQRRIDYLLENVVKSGLHAAAIVKNMLSFARENSIMQENCSIRKVIDDTIELARSDYNLKKKFDFKKIRIIKNYEDPEVLLRCDASKIQQVFLNIFRNGAEAMNEVQKENYNPEFRIDVFSGKKMLCVEITDNGPGINDETIKDIFNPFFTTKEVDKGTGLGLSISFFIIKQLHNGNLLAESQLGEWTKFIIELPVD